MFRPVLKVLETLHFCEHVIFGGRPHKVENLEQLVTVVVEVRWLETKAAHVNQQGSVREKNAKTTDANVPGRRIRAARERSYNRKN